MAIKKAPKGVDKDLSTRIDALDGAGEIELTMLAANAEGKVIVYNASQVATAVAMSGDVTIAASGATAIGNNKITNAMLGDNVVGNAELADNAVTQAELGDDAVGAAELKVVVRDISVAGGASTGTATNAADANGVVIGHSVSNVENAVKTIALTAGTGQIDVTLAAAQAAEQVGHVYVVVLQA